jgi:hypothetical protein
VEAHATSGVVPPLCENRFAPLISARDFAGVTKNRNASPEALARRGVARDHPTQDRNLDAPARYR